MADDQKANVTYIDDTTGKTLKTTPLSGKTNAKSGYTTAKDIQAYKDLGYVLVSDSTNGAEIVFDNDDKNDQTFEGFTSSTIPSLLLQISQASQERQSPWARLCQLPRKALTKAGLADTVNRTITYRMSDGSKHRSGTTVCHTPLPR